MNNLDPREVEKLIGGYATGTLTEAEQQALFAEALGNQTLFDALADEEALRDLLSDPVARRQLLAALAPAHKQASLPERFSAWFFRPLTMTLAAGAAAAGLALIVVPRLTDGPKVEQVASSRQGAPPGDPARQQPIPEQAIVSSPAEIDRPAQPAALSSAKPQAPRRALSPGEPAAGSVGALGGPVAVSQGPATFAAPQPPAAPPPADAPRADTREQERKVAPVRREEAAQAPAGAGQTPAPPPPATAAPSPAKEAPEQRAIVVAKSSFAATVPFEYVLELQGADGSWSGIEPTARLREKDQVRVAVQANATGLLTVDLRLPGGAASNLYRAAIRPGQRLHVPGQGRIPAGEGEHRLVISYSAGVSTLGAVGFRQRAAAGNRSGKAEASRDDAGGAAPYSVEIPLRFR